GIYKVREVGQAGWLQTTPIPDDIAARSGVDAPGVDLGNFQMETVTGLVFLDNNGNQKVDPGDQGLPGRTIFLDANGNGVLDPGEVSTLTDSSGHYQFVLGPGTYLVREVLPPGFILTTDLPAGLLLNQSGATISGINFGNFEAVVISGKKFQ